MRLYRGHLIRQFLGALVAFAVAGCSPPTPTPTAAPAYTVSYYGPPASGNIAYLVGMFASGACHLSCSYQVTTSLPLAYEQAEIFLTGWHAENLGGLTTLQKLRLSATSVLYDPATGRFDWEASADIREAANSGDEYRFTLFFTIVLVRPAGARLTKFLNGCASAGIAAAGGQCQGHALVPQVIPPGWELSAVGVRGFQLEGGAGAPPSGILLQSLAMDASRWRSSGPDLVAYLGCEMHDMTPTEPMLCEMEGVALAVAPGEAFQARFSSSDQSMQSFGANTATPPPGLPVDGGFGGLARFSLTFGAAEARTWSWAADYNDIVICPNMTDFCYNRIGFLADKFGSNVNNLPFTVENSGFAVWTRP